jgi:hypothetical protein
MTDNRQLSPVTWTALINRNPVKWFIEGQSDVVNLMKRTNENLSFDISIINRGGTAQSYTIDLPSWLTLSNNSGIIAPNSKTTLQATVESNLAIGNYNVVLSLATSYGYNEKIQLDLRVLEKEPILVLDPSKFSQTMNIIGKIKLDGVFTDDLYDKVVATVNGEVRGITNVIYDASLKEYFVFMTIYSNEVSGEMISFYIWDASDGKLKEAVLNDQVSVAYQPDQILGTFTNPVIFKNTAVTGQQIVFNQGWTWTSFNVNDPRFPTLNTLTRSLTLKTSDLIKSNTQFDTYDINATNPSQSGWSGTVSINGGISLNKMYKIRLTSAQKLNVKGVPVDLNTWSFTLSQNWNWLPYVVSKNIPITDALANLQASDGDVIKSQSLFAIYSPTAGWKGSLTYLKVGEGYMLKTNIGQPFSYPEYLNRLNTKMSSIKVKQNSTSKTTSIENENMVVISKDYSKFANTMNAVVKLPENYQDLSFYNESGELRGNAQTQNVEGKDLAFITIYGDKSEKLTAYIGVGNSAHATSKTINFAADAILGSLAEPVIIDFSLEKINVFPNPFHHEFEVTIDSQESGVSRILIYDMLSKIVYESSAKTTIGANVIKVQPNIPTGVYILKIQKGDKILYQKIIKN